MLRCVHVSILVGFLFVLPTGLEWFQAPKAAALRVCGAVALGLALGASPWPKLASLRAIDFVAIGLLLAELLATAASDAPLLSLVGEPTQRGGLLTSLALAGIFVATRIGTKDAAGARATVDWFLAGTAIACLYGLLQALGMDPLPWAHKSDIGGFPRPFGTMGHPNLLGVVSGMGLAAALANAVLSPMRRARYGALALLFGTITIATMSRAAWIAAALGGPVTLIAAARAAGFSRSTRRTLVAAGAVAVLVLAAAVLFGPGHLLHRRLTDMLAGFSGSGVTRREIWRTAIAAWKGSPWFGHGPDTFALVFPRYQTPLYWTVEYGALPTQAHSIYLQLLATRGIFGCAVSVAAVVTTAGALASAWRAGGELRGAAIMAAGPMLVALLAGAFGTLGAVGALAVAVCAGTLAALGAIGRPQPHEGGHGDAQSVLRKVLPAIVLGCIALAWSTAEILAWHEIREATDLELAASNAPAEARDDLWAEAATRIRRAAREMPADDRIQAYRVEILMMAQQFAADSESMLQEAEDAARAAVKRAPLRAYAYKWLGAACLERARAGHLTSLAAGISAYERSMELSPFDSITMLEYERYMLALGRPADALSLSERAAALYPDNGSVIWRLSQALTGNQRSREARAALERSVSLPWPKGDRERIEAKGAWEAASKSERR